MINQNGHVAGVIPDKCVPFYSITSLPCLPGISHRCLRQFLVILHHEVQFSLTSPPHVCAVARTSRSSGGSVPTSAPAAAPCASCRTNSACKLSCTQPFDQPPPKSTSHASLLRSITTLLGFASPQMTSIPVEGLDSLPYLASHLPPYPLLGIWKPLPLFEILEVVFGGHPLPQEPKYVTRPRMSHVA